MTIEFSGPTDAESREHQEAFGRNQFSQQLVKLVDRVRGNDPTLKELDLLELYRCSQFSHLAWEILGRYIAVNTHLETLSLPPFAMGAVSPLPLFNNMTGSSSLKTLFLQHRQLGLDGVQIIVPFLKNSPNLSQIYFGENQNIDSECFEAIIEALNGGPVKALDSDFCSISDVSALENANLPHLQTLNLRRNNIESVPSLDSFTNLQKLELEHNRIQTIPSLEMLTNLEELLLDDNRIGNEGCKEIAKLLRSSHSSLKELTLSRNGISGEGAEIVANSLRNNSTLKTLYMFGNELKEDGCRAFLSLLNDVSSVESTLSSNHTLLYLHLPFSSSSVSTKLKHHLGNARRINVQNKAKPCAAGRAKVIATQLNNATRRELCGLQGVEYSYGSIFDGIDPILLPNLLALASKVHGRTELYQMLVAIAPDITSLIDRKALLRNEIASNSSSSWFFDLISDLTKMLKSME